MKVTPRKGRKPNVRLTDREKEIVDLANLIHIEGFEEDVAAHYALTADPNLSPDFAIWMRTGEIPEASHRIS